MVIPYLALPAALRMRQCEPLNLELETSGHLARLRYKAASLVDPTQGDVDRVELPSPALCHKAK